MSESLKFIVIRVIAFGLCLLFWAAVLSFLTSCSNIHSSFSAFYETKDGVKFEYTAEETIESYK